MPNSDARITRDQLIRWSFRRLGNTSPSTTEMANAVTVLNALMKELDEEGRWLTAISNTPTVLNIIAGTSIYTVGTAPTGIANNIMHLENFELVRGTTRLRLRIVPKTESTVSWYREGLNGDPVLAHIEQAPNLSSQRLILLPNPISSDIANYTYQRRLYDFDNATDNPDVPAGWDIKLVKMLAGELAPEFVNAQEVQGHLILAKEAKDKARAANKEKTTPIQQYGRYF